MTLNCVILPFLGFLIASVQVIHGGEGNTDGRNPLYEALEANQTAQAQQLLQQGACPNRAVRPNGCRSSLLHVAVNRDQGYVAAQLLDMGAKISARNCNNLTAMEYAILEGRSGVIREMVKAGYGLGKQPLSTEPPLFFAVSHNKSHVVTTLLELGADVHFVNEGQTPLSIAIKNGLFDVADTLVRAGANVSFTFPDGDTYLHKAARSDDLGSLVFFLGAGLKADLLNGKGETPLDVAVVADNHRIVDALLAKGASARLDHVSLAVEHNSTSALAVLIERGVTDDKPLGTLLNNASKSGQSECVRLLLKAGANVSFSDPNDYDRTPLHQAAIGGHEDIAKMLLDAGADIEARESDGMTPLNEAADGGHAGVVRLLLDRGAEIDNADGGDWTPLMTAAGSGRDEVVQLLIDRGARLNAKDGDGHTPLQHAAANNRTETAELIRKRGGT